MPLLVEFPGKSLRVIGYAFDLCFIYPRRHSSSDHISQLFRLYVIYGTLSLTPLILFIHLLTNQRSRPRAMAQYMILGPYPYNYHIGFPPRNIEGGGRGGGGGEQHYKVINIFLSYKHFR